MILQNLPLATGATLWFHNLCNMKRSVVLSERVKKIALIAAPWAALVMSETLHQTVVTYAKRPIKQV